MDYSKLRKDISKRENAETVSVNHRALITRTLTKYPVDFALFRELLQNSADARASHVVISFESSIPNPVSEENIGRLHEAPITRLTVKNNGALFGEDDWSRLKEIAKGNPNESKIGAFGVGFYSVFEVTDSPLVHSGSTVMSFYYSGDQLMYRRDTTDKSDWTVIDLPYRSPGVLPTLPQFTAFLTQSFMLVPLSSIDLEINGKKLLQLTKIASPSSQLAIAPFLNTRSPDKTLTVTAASAESFQVAVKYMNCTQEDHTTAKSNILSFGRRLFASFKTSSEIPSDVTSVTCFLRKVTGRVSVNVSTNFSNKMKETVMKRPPKEAIISMLTSSREEKELSELKPPLSDYIFPPETNDAKIFIGFPTKQSTSIKNHIAINQLIPTMERTAIDMSNAFVRNWNEQMLYAAGTLCRIIYEAEMQELARLDKETMMRNACFIMDKFTFQRSTPDQRVGDWITSGFYSACRNQLTVPSQVGIKTTNEVRLPTKHQFFKTVPILPLDVPSGFIERAKQLNLISSISASDVIREVQSRPLNKVDFGLYVQWLADSIRAGRINQTEKQRILAETVVTDSTTTVPLAGIQYFQRSEEELPQPTTCIKYEIIRDSNKRDLEIIGWQELDIVTWAQFIAQQPEMQLSPEFSVKALVKLNSLWSTLDKPRADAIIAALHPVPCISTQLGMQIPSQAYLVEIPMFPNLPVKAKSLDAVSNQFLFSLGLRESVDMAFVLKLLHDPKPSDAKWSTYDVVKYLTTHQKSLKKSDWDLLRTSKFFQGSDGQLWKAHELYAPHGDIEKLGFRTLQWPQPWVESSSESKLLYYIGLKRCPSSLELFTKGGESQQFAKIAVRYYLQKFDDNKYMYDAKATAKLPAKIIPCTDGKTYAPAECFIDNEAQLFGFPVVNAALRADAWKFGIEKVPSGHQLTEAFLNNLPKSAADADTIYSYLSTRMGELGRHDLERLTSSRCIFVGGKHVSPGQVFMNSPDYDVESQALTFLRPMFDYIGASAQAIPFLTRVGVRSRPDIRELANAAVDRPAEAYKLAGSREKYERFMSALYVGWKSISSDDKLVRKMADAKFLIGLSVRNVDAGDDDGYEKEVEQVSLVSAREVAIVNDIIAFGIFKEEIKTAPQVSDIEKLYVKLGAPKISSIVREELSLGRRTENEKFVSSLKKIIVQRVTVFLDKRKSVAKMRASELEKMRIQPLTSIVLTRSAQLPAMRYPTAKIKENLTACFDQTQKNLLYVVQGENGGVDWFDVSKALVKVVLERPDPESVLILETMLSSDLRMLRKKGFNVDRLLKQQQHEREARDAELERMRKDAEKLQRLETEEAQKKQREQESAVNKMPGGFLPSPPQPQAQTSNFQSGAPPPQSPLAQAGSNAPIAAQADQLPPPPAPTQPAIPTQNSMFNRLKKLGGFDTPRQTASPTTPSPSPSVPNLQAPRAPPPQQSQQRVALDPRDVLRKGIANTQQFHGKQLQANVQSQDEQRLKQNTEIGCHRISPQDLVHAFRLDDGPDVYIQRGSGQMGSAEMDRAAMFREVLANLAGVFGMQWSSVHMFMSQGSEVVAFNMNGALFFNLAYFEANRADWRSWGMNFWYPVVAHELAHNLISEHGAAHTHYLESYIQVYMDAFKRMTSTL